MRQTIFISHATPNDNALASWLAARLSSLGYRVWVDLEKLKGGDPFWRDIQAAIREQAVRFLCVVTQTSMTRQGVLNEIAEACSAAKNLNDPRFIIPLRGDFISWDDFPIQLKTLNGIDFSESWHRGLLGVLDAFNRDEVPRFEGDSEISRTARLIATSASCVRDAPEEAFLNRLQIQRLPDSIRYFRTALTAPDLLKFHAQVPWPHAPFQRLLLGFLEIEASRLLTPELFEIEPAYTATTEEFASGKATGVPGIKGSDARRMLSSMIRQGFEGALTNAGLVPFGDGRWFVPVNWRPANIGRYRKLNGKLGDRVLVGKAKELTWHFGLSFTVDAGRRPRIDLRPEVLFSPDGVRPFDDQKQLRRKHCKLWWNDRWRDLLLALLAELFGLDAETVEIGLGGSTSLTLNCKLSKLVLTRSYDAERSFVPVTDEEAEELADANIDEGSDE